ncbi:MAG: prepilin peptidase [Candidatus Saccharimonadales bacterium]
MEFIVGIYLFIVGASMGSFAGAMAWRIEKGRNVVKERSECEHCHHQLSIFDLIPVISWLWLRGTCRYCKKPIGWTAFALEVILGLLFVLSYTFWGYEFTSLGLVLFVLWLVSLVGLAILFVYDARHFILPDVIVWPLAVLGLLFFILAGSIDNSLSALTIGAIASLVPITGVYGALYIVSKGKWIGLGDVKLGVFIGLLLGWQGALLVLMLSNILGTLWIIPALATKRLTKNDQVPFGPFLILATVVVFFIGKTVIDGYLTVVGI